MCEKLYTSDIDYDAIKIFSMSESLFISACEKSSRDEDPVQFTKKVS